MVYYDIRYIINLIIYFMKKLLIYVLIWGVFISPNLAIAAEFRTGENIFIGKSEKIINDVYIAGGSVNSSGFITGDLITAGGSIIINGDVSSDVIAAGGNINILSNVGDDVRLAGGTIILGGKIGGDLILGGGQVNISGDGILGDVIIGGGNVYINAPIGGNVMIEADKVTLGSLAVISGNLTYRATKELIKEEGAVVKGVIDFKLRDNKSISSKFSTTIFSEVFLWEFLTLLACAFLIGLTLRRYNKEIIILTISQPFHLLGKGILTLIIFPLVFILLFVTLIGIPLGLLGLLGFIILLIFSWIMVPIILGSIIFRYFFKKELEISWKTIFFGALIYSIIGIIPFLGVLLKMVLILITLGALITFKWRVIKEWK